jgi:hypothetical protein
MVSRRTRQKIIHSLLAPNKFEVPEHQFAINISSIEALSSTENFKALLVDRH